MVLSIEDFYLPVCSHDKNLCAMSAVGCIIVPDRAFQHFKMGSVTEM
jgi:hypothetical protein